MNSQKKEKALINIPMPFSDWKAKSITDESNKDDDYFKNLKNLDDEYKISETLGMHKMFENIFQNKS